MRSAWPARSDPAGRARDRVGAPLCTPPLAGVSYWPFRLLCREMGASSAHTEMISSHGLVHGGDQTLSYLERPPDERPFAIQVFGHVAEVLAEGARVAVEKYGPIDAVDINMGCPVKKVCCHGAGAAMLKDPAERSEE